LQSNKKEAVEETGAETALLRRRSKPSVSTFSCPTATDQTYNEKRTKPSRRQFHGVLMMKEFRYTLFGACLIGASLAPLSARNVVGDEFHLANGGRVEGQLLNPNQSPRENYIVRSGLGATLTLAEEQVDHVVVKSEMERRYEARLQTLPNTVEAHFDMARRCQLAKMEDQRLFHLEQVLRLDPEHKEARYALGFSQIDGNWIRQDEWMAKQGYVRDRGAWRLPQEMEIEKATDAEDQIAIEWRKKLKTWRSWIIKNRDKAREGEMEIRGIRDPYAAVALVEQLGNEKEPRQLKLLYVDILGRLPPNAVGIDGLVKHAMDDPDGKVREACLDEVTRVGSQRALESFLIRLKDPERLMVHRAAIGLARLNAQAATLPLIEALITEHKVLTGSGSGGLSPTFSDQGGGLTAGGGPKIEEKEFRNEPVLHALTSLHRGVNFGFNQAAWKNWYVAQNVPQKVNLRRSN